MREESAKFSPTIEATYSWQQVGVDFFGRADVQYSTVEQITVGDSREAMPGAVPRARRSQALRVMHPCRPAGISGAWVGHLRDSTRSMHGKHVRKPARLLRTKDGPLRATLHHVFAGSSTTARQSRGSGISSTRRWQTAFFTSPPSTPPSPPHQSPWIERMAALAVTMLSAVG
jgi:hypothetical protein